MKTNNPVVWFEIYVDDMERARKFYEATLDLKMNEIPNPQENGAKLLAFPMDMDTRNRASGALIQMEGFEAGNNSTIVYFMSEDCSIEEGRVEAAGGMIHQTKSSLGEYGFMVLAYDTEGNMIGIHSMK